MARLPSERRLIVNADDFGRSRSINEAIVRAHREGVLTSASLMVNGEAFDEAVALARQHPSLGVGLHLTLVCGASTLGAESIPGLVNGQGQFSNGPIRAGLAYFFQRALRLQLSAEMGAQFDKFHETGLSLDHVNGHLNLQLHPAILAILLKHAPQWGVKALRVTRDPFWLNARVESGRWLYRLSHALIFSMLSGRTLRRLRRSGIRHTDRVFGLLQNGAVNEAFLRRLLPRLPAGDSELYSHPSLAEFKHEFDALVGPRVRQLIRDERIELIRYQDL